mmetsp:Transcript_28283/g.72712  ORF Transcript_28283/g.72712 Transcript_28283/m.72712 type:complete len:193 (+) Transcript_28283:84-662(+)
MQAPFANAARAPSGRRARSTCAARRWRSSWAPSGRPTTRRCTARRRTRKRVRTDRVRHCTRAATPCPHRSATRLARVSVQLCSSCASPHIVCAKPQHALHRQERCAQHTRHIARACARRTALLFSLAYLFPPAHARHTLAPLVATLAEIAEKFAAKDEGGPRDMRAVKKIDEWLGIKPKVPTAWQKLEKLLG